MTASLAELRSTYQAHRKLIFDALTTPEQVDAALRAHALAVDDVLIQQWHKHDLHRAPVTLVAVGGYGRLELFPHSDVDILLLHDAPDVHAIGGIAPFLTEAWDLGFDVGHSVRSVDECIGEARKDVTVATALLERRPIVGAMGNVATLNQRWQQSFDVERFVSAKRFEQQQRYTRYEDTAYNLEPNVKESPGGLRDVHMVLWVATAMRGATSLAALVEQGLLGKHEHEALVAALRQIRFLRTQLHLIARRREDRLLFELQHALAEAGGLQAAGGLRASEVLMQRYYRAARQLRLYNDILIDALTQRRNAPKTALPETAFALCDDKLDLGARGTNLDAIETLQAFLLVHQQRRGTSFTPELRRAVLRAATRVSDDAFAEPNCRELFLTLLRGGQGVYHALKAMSELGVLGKLLPPWRRIVGQMQHDLFHVYTVDQHILMVLRNMRRFADPAHSHEYPLCSRLMEEFPERELLYLACLFHDIAKGRGGDHSELGMVDARSFCAALGLGHDHVEFVAWLVEHHLVMSTYAQKRDIADPSVIEEFANIVASDRRLVALYLLTVADIRGTSPKVWNNWKASLLEQLLRATQARLGAAGDGSVFDLLADRLIEARRLLALYAIDATRAEALWRTLDSVYLQRHTADEIAWHARTLYFRIDGNQPVVRTRLLAGGEGLQVMLYLRDRTGLFATVMGVFARLSLSVLDARVHTSRLGYALDTFTVVSPDTADPAYRELTPLLEHELQKALQSEQPPPAPALGKATRQQRHFPIQPTIEITPDEEGQRYILEITAADRAGLLARIAGILTAHHVSIETARINTLGARAEDVFVVSGGRLTEEAARIALETELAEALA
ncbi:MAG: [protein-PII] uridylyltransferase [Burkholderiales bacterium]|nr:[protein-PII] uridylyltransferase [Pseudomonadota bacterium]MCC7068805.1 [protein-PII] uridylyltransferase [Burkholderiales bacterium]